jgi:CxxC-x17-CxxC domain-containing protein
MADYRKPGGFSGGRGGGFNRGGAGFGGRPDFKRDDRNGGDRELFNTTCASCHKPCQVPFRPNGEKPVYCRDCFRTNRETPSSDFSRRDDRAPAPHFQKREFTPSFSQKPRVEDRRIDDLKRMIESLNTKVDRIMQLVGNGASVASVAEKKAEKGTVDVSLNTIVTNAVAKSTKADVKTGKKTDKKSAKKKVVSKKK